jgi:hypothetical protein
MNESYVFFQVIHFGKPRIFTTHNDPSVFQEIEQRIEKNLDRKKLPGHPGWELSTGHEENVNLRRC